MLPMLRLILFAILGLGSMTGSGIAAPQVSDTQAEPPREPAAAPATEATQASPEQASAADARTHEEWQARERELLARIQRLELELAQEQALRLQREQEWMQFTQLLQLIPEEKRPPVPEFLRSEEDEAAPDDPEALQQERAQIARRKRAQEIKRTLRAYLRAEGQHAFDLLEVGGLHEDGIGPIVARQLDAQGRFLSTLVADRLRLEKSASGYTLTLVLERGYERRAGQTWPFPSPTGSSDETSSSSPEVALDEQGEEQLGGEDGYRRGVLRLALPGVAPGPWIQSMPELFSPADRDAIVDDGRTNLIRLRFALNALLDQNTRGAHWKLVHLGGVVGEQWRQMHFAELDRRGRVVRRLFADRGHLRLEGNNAIFELQAGAQERDGRRSAFLGDRYTLLVPGIDPAAWRSAGLPGVAPELSRSALPPAPVAPLEEDS